MGTLTPAYGRDYKNKAALVTDWIGGKDFMLNSMTSSGYCSSADFTAIGTTLQARYNGQRSVCVLRLTAKGWKA